MRRGHGNSQNRIGAEAALVVGTVEFDQFSVKPGLIGAVETLQGLEDLAVNVGHCPENALAEKAALVAVAEFDGLVDAGGGAGGNSRHAPRTARKRCRHLHGRVPAGVKNFKSFEMTNFRHSDFLWEEVAEGRRLDSNQFGKELRLARGMARPPLVHPRAEVRALAV